MRAIALQRFLDKRNSFLNSLQREVLLFLHSADGVAVFAFDQPNDQAYYAGYSCFLLNAVAYLF